MPFLITYHDITVRSGSKNQDWEDLARADIDVVMPNQKASGTALCLWALSGSVAPI